MITAAGTHHLFPWLINLLLNPLILLIIILTLTSLYIIYRLRSAKFGALKYGRVVMADHSKNWRPCHKSFFSKKYLLTGKIDYVVKNRDGGMIPVEMKSTSYRGRIYDSHRLEVGTACLLIEEQYRMRPDKGIIQYRGGETFEIPYTQNLKQQVIQTMQEMRSLQLPRGWHPDARRCRSCSMRLKCSMAAG